MEGVPLLRGLGDRQTPVSLLNSSQDIAACEQRLLGFVADFTDIGLRGSRGAMFSYVQ